MTREETGKLFVLLGTYYPNARQLSDKLCKAAWAMALEPYRYEDAKAAAVAYVRKNRFFPDVFDITDKLPEVDMAKPDDEQDEQRRSGQPWMLPHIQKIAAEAAVPLGVLPWPEAKADGVSWAEWVEAYRQHGGFA